MKAKLKGIALLCVIVMALQIFAVPVWAESTSDAPEIVTQPTSYEGAIGSTAIITVEATGEGLRYQWYYSNDNGRTWSISKLEGNDTATVYVQVKAFRDGQQYKCVITDANGKTVDTEVVTVTVQRVALAIVKEPENYVGPVGTTATFHVEAVGEGLTYQWYFSNNNGRTWSVSTLEGNDTATVYVPVKTFRDGQQYQCVITDNRGKTVSTEIVALTIQDVALMIITEPEDYTGAVGTTATFSVEAVGSGLRYQWYYSSNDGKTWSLSTMDGATTSQVSVLYKAFRAGQQYKCVVKDSAGNTVESAVAILGGQKTQANVEITDARIKSVSNGTVVDGEGVKVDSTANPSDVYYPASVSADKLSATFGNVSMTLPGAWAEFSVTLTNNGTANANLSDCILEATGVNDVIVMSMPDLTGVVLTPGDSCMVTFVAQVPAEYSAPTLDAQGTISVHLIFT